MRAFFFLSYFGLFQVKCACSLVPVDYWKKITEIPVGYCVT